MAKLNWRTEDGGIWNPYKNKAMLKNRKINELETELAQIFEDLAYEAEWTDLEQCPDDCRCDACGPIHHLIDQLQQEFRKQYAKYGITKSFLSDEEREAWK